MANESSKLTNPWFEHDESASNDGKILKMFRDFRKLVKTLDQRDLEDLAVLGSYGIFWRIIEYMHGDLLAVDEADVIADDLRIETKFVEMILQDFELFRKENGYYISDRVLKNLERRKEKSKKNSEAINVRWLIYAFNEAYKEFFNEEPVLSSKEIENLKNYAKKIPDLKEKLRDIIYTLSTLKFDTDIKFIPCANWLLKDNHLGRLVNGEFGKLKHKPTEKEIKKQQQEEAKEFEEKNKPSELEVECECCTEKTNAVNIIKNFYSKEAPAVYRGKYMLIPTLRKLMEKFEITEEEIGELWQN